MSTSTEIPTSEAVKILGLPDRGRLIALIHAKRLKSTRKLPGTTGTYMFRRADVLRLAEEFAAEARAEAEAREGRLAEAKAAMGVSS